MIRNFGTAFSVAATVRSDGHVNVDRDSARVSTVDLPYTFGLGLRWRARPKLKLASQVLRQDLVGANSDLLAQGGTGADNTTRSRSAASSRRTLASRPGVRSGSARATARCRSRSSRATSPTSSACRLGTGIRFAQERAGIDLGLEHVWRSRGRLLRAGPSC